MILFKHVKCDFQEAWFDMYGFLRYLGYLESLVEVSCIVWRPRLCWLHSGAPCRFQAKGQNTYPRCRTCTITSNTCSIYQCLSIVKVDVVLFKSRRVTVMESWYCGAQGSTTAQHHLGIDRRFGRSRTCQHGEKFMQDLPLWR
jgi:hypothetical protein